MCLQLGSLLREGLEVGERGTKAGNGGEKVVVGIIKPTGGSSAKVLQVG